MQKLETPWGQSQQASVVADGITKISTASHGGYRLSPERWIYFQSIFPDFKTFAGDCWFEEDQDWAMVALAFPNHFDEEQLFQAIRTVDFSLRISRTLGRIDQWKAVKQWLDSDPRGQALKDRADLFQRRHKDDWEAGSMSSGPGWIVAFTRLGDGARYTIVCKDYPTKSFYTDFELTQIQAPGV